MGKFGTLAIIWAAIIVSYIFIGTLMSLFSDVTTEASTAMQASANMSNQPGAVGMTESFPVYVWIIPGAIGIVSTVWILKRK